MVEKQVKVLSHLHTRYSFDSMLSPNDVIERAAELGFDVAIIADHNVIGGSIDALSIGREHGVIVIPAVEFSTDIGDIMGLFIDRAMPLDGISPFKKKHHWRHVVEYVHGEGGLLVLPHPYKSHKLDPEICEAVDLIETFNARCSPGQNRRSKDLLKLHDKAEITGNDAHLYPEIGLAFTVFDWDGDTDDDGLKKMLIEGKRELFGEYSKPIFTAVSITIMLFRLRRVELFAQAFMRLGFKLVSKVRKRVRK